MQTAADSLLTPQFALAGAVLAAGGAAFASLPLGMLRHAYPRRQVRPVAWGGVHLGLVALLYFFIGPVLAAFAGGVAGQEMDLMTAILVTAASQAIVVAAILYWARKNDPYGAVGLGLQSGGNLRAALLGGLAGVMCFPAVIGANLLWPWLFERFGGHYQQQSLIEGFQQTSGGGWLLAFLAAAIVVPLLEELIFRGFLQSFAIQRLGEVRGLTLTAAIFAILHGASAFLPIFVLALVLGVVMVRTGRIVGPWLLHGLFNGGQLLLLLVSDGMNGLPQ